MSCQCSCSNTLNFCTADICNGEIDFDIIAQIEGVHKMTTYFLDSQLTISKEFLAGEQIIFPLDNLNESFQYTSQLFDPNGNKILIRKNGIDYDCFKFKVVINVPYSAN